MRARHLLWPCLALLGALAPGQVALNQVDTFQDGTTQQWSGGSAPVNIPNGGPSGAGDRYLQISGVDHFLATFNINRWFGDYPATGVNRIEADLRNTGPNPLVIRLVLFSTSGDRWSSNVGITLPAGSAWTHVAFDIEEANFTQTVGFTTFASTIANMGRIMFRHEPVISAGGTSVTGTLGIDNVAGYAKSSTLSMTAYTIIHGFVVTGAIPQTVSSDDNYLVIRQNPFRSRQDPAVQIEPETTAPPGAFSSIRFTLETQTSAVPANLVTQRIELFSYTSNSWVQIDSRPSTSADQTVDVIVSTNVNQYINPTTRLMRARLSYFDPGTLVTRAWNVSFDQIRWILTR